MRAFCNTRSDFHMQKTGSVIRRSERGNSVVVDRKVDCVKGGSTGEQLEDYEQKRNRRSNKYTGAKDR